jgi:thioredoxin reductase (NADPH)
VTHDVAVVGGGPTGLAAAFFAAQRGLKTVLIEQAGLGGELATLGAIDGHPLLAANATGPDVAALMTERALDAGVEMAFEEALELEPTRPGWGVRTDARRIEASAVIVATGAGQAPLGVPGETELLGRGVSTCAGCDGPLFAGRRVAVVGATEWALRDAITLAPMVREVVLVHEGADVKAGAELRARAGALANVELEAGARVCRIVGEGSVESVQLVDEASGALRELVCDAVFLQDERIPRTGLVDPHARDRAGAHPTGNPPLEVGPPGLFVVGDVRLGSGNLAQCLADAVLAARAVSNGRDVQSPDAAA